MTEDRTGFLTDGDLWFLGRSKEDHDGTHQHWYQGKARLRTSLLTAIGDFPEVQEHLSSWNWPKVVDEIRDNEGSTRSGMTAAIALFYEIHQAMGWDFERTLHEAVDRAYTHGSIERNLNNRIVDDVSVNLELVDNPEAGEMRERVKAKLENQNPLTDGEKAWLLEHGGPLREQWESRERESHLRRKKRAKDKYTDTSEE